MDTTENRTSFSGAIPLTKSVALDVQTEWLNQGWRPYFVTEHKALSSIENAWRLRGLRDGRELELFIKVVSWAKPDLIQLRRIDSGGFRLSAAVQVDDGSIQEVSVDAFETLSSLKDSALDCRLGVPTVSQGSGAREFREPASEAPILDWRARLQRHATNVQASLGWRPFTVKSIERLPDLTDGWCMRGSWFHAMKTLHLRAKAWSTATDIFARREDEDRFSLRARIRGDDGETVSVMIDAFERRESLSATEQSPRLLVAWEIARHLNATKSSGSVLILLAGSGAGHLLQVIAGLLNTEAVGLGNLSGLDPKEPSSHVGAIEWAAHVTRAGPLLLDRLEVLKQLAGRVNPLWILTMISVGRQVVAVWPGTYREGELALTADSGEISYPSANVAVWMVD